MSQVEEGAEYNLDGAKNTPHEMGDDMTPC